MRDSLVTCAWVDDVDPALLLPALHEAEEDDARILAALANGQHDVLCATRGGELVGAALVRWATSGSDRASQIVYLGVIPAARRQGVGRALVDAVVAEAPAHGDGRIEVGTASASLDNLGFYQRCGLRMERIERDHFAYIDPPAFEYGVQVRDLVVFSNHAPPSTAPQAPRLFCSTELAAEIEAAEAELMAGCSAASADPERFARPVAGGFATYSGAASPFTKIAGIGFSGVPSAAELSALERAYGDRGAPACVELSTLADPAVAEMLGSRGYRLAGVENVLGCRLPAPSATIAPGVTIERTGDLEAWLDLDVRATLHPDPDGVEPHERYERGAIEQALRQLISAGSVAYLAHRDGRPAGAGSMRIAGRVAQLNGASTLPEHRRRGVQSAMLATRLSIAHAAGAEIATVTTQPGSRSQRNVQRAGFDLLYARSILVKAPA